MPEMVDHGHRGAMVPTGYEQRRIEVAKGVNTVLVPVPTYDEMSALLCNFCADVGEARWRESQDFLDGAALRRLLEVRGGKAVALLWYAGKWTCEAGIIPAPTGATIAEAADACREALERETG